MRNPACLAAVLLAALPCAAQSTSSIVVPAAQATADGNNLDKRPFGYDRIRVTQYVGPSLLVNRLPLRKSVVSVAYRRDAKLFPVVTLSRSTTPIWTIRAGNYLPVVGRRPDLFLSPGDGSLNSLTTVFNAKQVVFPSLTVPTTGLPGFDIKFPFDAPLVYIGGWLAFDHYCYESSGREHDYYIDAERLQIDSGDAQVFGDSCPKDANRAYAMSSNPGSTVPIRFLLYDSIPSTTAIGIIGASNKVFGPYSLPIDLKVLGLPGCWQHVSVDLLLPVATKSTGAAQLDLLLPPDPGLVDVTFYFQWLSLDPRVSTKVPMSFSNGVQVRTGKSFATYGLEAYLLYQLSNLANSSSGFIDPDTTFVTEIGYQ
ncbi:MAG: hypothetical protein R3F30_01085 [Planctomycetota bacterium]